MTDQLYSPAQAAALIINGNTGQPGISLSRVNELCRSGRLGRQVGRAWIITQAEIDEFNAAPKPTQWEGRQKRRDELKAEYTKERLANQYHESRC
jgi:hypothetical protein